MPEEPSMEDLIASALEIKNATRRPPCKVCQSPYVEAINKGRQDYRLGANTWMALFQSKGIEVPFGAPQLETHFKNRHDQR